MNPRKCPLLLHLGHVSIDRIGDLVFAIFSGKCYYIYVKRAVRLAGHKSSFGG
jgi:hypothetical protein